METQVFVKCDLLSPAAWLVQAAATEMTCVNETAATGRKRAFHLQVGFWQRVMDGEGGKQLQTDEKIRQKQNQICRQSRRHWVTIRLIWDCFNCSHCVIKYCEILWLWLSTQMCIYVHQKQNHILETEAHLPHLYLVLSLQSIAQQSVNQNYNSELCLNWAHTWLMQYSLLRFCTLDFNSVTSLVL